MTDRRYFEYFRLFRKEKFFEAHEILENLWRETKGPEREFYQGLIQLAAVLVHYQRNNYPGAQELFRTASKYLGPYSPEHQGLDLKRILDDFSRFLEVWSQHSLEPMFAKKLLPRLK